MIDTGLSLHNLFPIPVGMFALGRDLTDVELSFIKSQPTRPNNNNDTSVNNTVLRDPLMTPLRGWVEDCVSKYFAATVNPKNDVHLRITQSWFNYSTKGQSHHRHAHPNSFISGVFYVSTTADDKIFFERNAYQPIKLPPKEWNIFNSESWWFEAKQGQLLLFPSSLQHNVPTIQNDSTRISMSFNTFPVGSIGDETELTALSLGA